MEENPAFDVTQTSLIPTKYSKIVSNVFYCHHAEGKIQNFGGTLLDLMLSKLHFKLLRECLDKLSSNRLATKYCPSLQSYNRKRLTVLVAGFCH
jgi:hypothetical protein